ncbi:hypothetical protein FHY18_000590 [Xanthomonas arboricola]|uniref:DUF4189 domain-containing protein n=1 Tax=Xanthomonas sp. 3793 TaxID=3035312 RepID=UPI0021670538|nr:DUF4189 domain-containing protein [Xanthomonas sp. 3793]MCS3745060.1 hypothetical protein [Xanthomonas sp. 3793]
MNGFFCFFCIIGFCAFLIGDADAQTACPIGTAAGSAVCGPTETGGGGYDNNEVPAPRAVPTGKWESRWGAIAIDSLTGSVGTSFDLKSKSAAASEAISTCAVEDSKKCKLITTYSNQCIALAWPSVKGRPASTGLAKEENYAKIRAIDNCNESGGDCKVIYSACSQPVFFKY